MRSLHPCDVLRKLCSLLQLEELGQKLKAGLTSDELECTIFEAPPYQVLSVRIQCHSESDHWYDMIIAPAMEGWSS